MRDVGVEYVEVLSRTLAAPHRAAFAPHQLALAADVELQLRLLAPVLGVLDSVVLQLGGTTDAGRLAAACGGPSSGGSSSGGDESSSPASILWTALYGALRLIDGPALEPAVERRLAAPSFGVRLLGQAAAAQRLLLASADQAAVDVRVAACAAAARLACRVAQQLLANHIARQQAAAEAPGACISDPQLMPAAAAMLQFLPAAAAAFRMAASEEAQQGGADPPEADTWGLCVWLAAAINLPLACEPAAVLSDCSSRLAAWCAAADAGLRLLPLLVRLQLGWQQRPSSGPPVPSEPGMPPPGALLARVLLKLWAVYLPPVSDALTIHTETSLGAVETARTMAQPLSQLHATVCRLVHWAAALDAEEAAVVPDLAAWRWLASAVHISFKEAFELNRALIDTGQRCAQAMGGVRGVPCMWVGVQRPRLCCAALIRAGLAGTQAYGGDVVGARTGAGGSGQQGGAAAGPSRGGQPAGADVHRRRLQLPALAAGRPDPCRLRRLHQAVLAGGRPSELLRPLPPPIRVVHAHHLPSQAAAAAAAADGLLPRHVAACCG